MNDEELDQEILDKEVLDELLMLDKTPDKRIISDLIREFISEFPASVSSLEKAGEESNWGQMKASAHSMKSSAGNLGGVRLSKACQKIENEAGGESSSELVSSLRTEFDLFLKALDEKGYGRFK